ncbi:MAG: hypothetical protein ACLSB9_07410 [Hydrogeniiclostridium mannosilyticum]
MTEEDAEDNAEQAHGENRDDHGKMDVVRSPQGVGQGKGGGPQQNGAAVMNKDKGSGKAERLR